MHPYENAAEIFCLFRLLRGGWQRKVERADADGAREARERGNNQHREIFGRPMERGQGKKSSGNREQRRAQVQI